MYLFVRQFSLIYQTIPKTNQALPQVMGELGAAKDSYLPLVYAQLSSELAPTNVAMAKGTYVQKFVNWAPLGENIIRRKKEGNVGFRAHPGHCRGVGILYLGRISIYKIS